MRALLPIFYREYKIRTTNLVWLFFDIVLPFGYLLLFGLGFSRAMGGGVITGGRTVGYSDFFLGGVLAMSSFGIAINASWSWFMDRDNGIFYELLTYPMQRGQLLLGKVLFMLVMSVLQSLVALAAGALLLGIPLLWSRLPLVFAGVMAGTAGWFFFFSIPALRIRRNDLYNTLINIIYFLLLFASTLFYPVEPLPAWMQWASRANPISWQTDFLRYATIGLGDATALARNAVLFAVFTAACFALAVRSLQAQE